MSVPETTIGHRLKCHLPPENCFLMFRREIPCFPVRLQKICETSNQMPPTKKSSTPCSWHVPGISWKASGRHSEHGQRTRRRISEGQAQRLSIARALLRHSPILLLDEATSALDVATERKVLKNIMQDTYPRTCIVTTHRPTVLNICTRVYAIREKKCEVLKDEEIEKLMGDF